MAWEPGECKYHYQRKNERMNDVKNEKKLNNKGFSLVELIIVIAIMAVLVGVLAPQYLKYVEKSRQSADLDNYEMILSAIETWAADPDNTMTAGTVDCSTTAVTATDGCKSALEANAPGYNKIKMKSTAYGKCKIEAKLDSTGTYYIFTFDNDKVKDALGR